MNDIELKLNDQNRGAFVIDDGEERLAEMTVGITEENIVVYHTEVADKMKGQGLGGKLVKEMVEYARKNHLKVVPLCAYVLAQFKRYPDQYADVWNKKWHG